MDSVSRALRQGAVDVARSLRAAGYEAWFAGGCVRDLLLGQSPKDWDIATDATPPQVQAVFPRTIAVGAAFGVVQVLHGKGRSYEVATFRADGEYADGRRPTEVHYSKSAEEDVKRRDFTINALLMDPETEEIVDYVGGREDLSAGYLRAVGNPQERFREDRLRMLRAVRFASRLGFSIEVETWSALTTEAAHLGVVSPERITQELDAVFGHSRVADGLRLLRRSGLAAVALPAGVDEELETQATRASELGEDREGQTELVWGLVTAHVDDAEAELRARKMSKARMRGVEDLHRTDALVSAATTPRVEILRLARSERRARRQGFLSARHGAGAVVERFSEAAAWLDAHPPAEAALLGGGDLKALGLTPGPQFKSWLEEVEGAVLEGRVKTREEALALVRRLAQSS